MYFSQQRIDPVNPDRVYLGGVGMHMSINGGRSFEPDAALVTHDDVHAIWIDPRTPDHLLIGNDGGLAVSYDMSQTWTFNSRRTRAGPVIPGLSRALVTLRPRSRRPPRLVIAASTGPAVL